MGLRVWALNDIRDYITRFRVYVQVDPPDYGRFWGPYENHVEWSCREGIGI